MIHTTMTAASNSRSDLNLPNGFSTYTSNSLNGEASDAAFIQLDIGTRIKYSLG